MTMLKHCILVAISTAPLVGHTSDDTWAKIVVDLVTPEMSKKGLEFEQNALVKPESELTFVLKHLGGEGKFSIKAITKKYGKPVKIGEFATKEDDKVVSYRQVHYPPNQLRRPSGQ